MSGMIREFIIYHKDDPEKTVKLRTLQNLSVCAVKEKVVKNGLFEREVISELRVTRSRR